MTDKYEPVGYITHYDLSELADNCIGGHVFPAGTLRPENEVALYVTPKLKVTDEMVRKAAEAYCEADGMNPNNWVYKKKHIRIALETALS